MGNCITRSKMKDGADDEADHSLDGKAKCKNPKPPPVIPTLVSLAVNGAAYDGARWWAVVSAVGRIDVVATTQPADNNGEWAQIAWSNGGVTQDPPNTRSVGLRGPRNGLQVTAQLNGAPQSVTIDVYDLISLGCNLRIARPGNVWKDYAGFVVGGIARMTATTDRNQAWPKLVWNPPEVAGPALNEQDYATAAVGDVPLRVALGDKDIAAVLHLCAWPVLAVQDITFSGGHTVNNDTVANFDNHWRVGRAVGTLDPSPLCYTRNTAITLTVTLNVTTHPTEAETVTVRGTAAPGGANMVWTSAAITVNPGDATVSFPAAVAGSAALPDVVAAYNPVTITWEMLDPNGNWVGIGTTQHKIYVTLGNPTVTPAYLTLLHYSCTGAAGAANDQALITGAFTPVTGRNLIRQRDNIALCYWDPPGAAAQVPNANAVWTTALLLAAPLGRGHCGSWAQFLIDLFRVHGVTTGHQVNVTRAAVVQQIGPVVLTAAANPGFLVATWNFAATTATSATDLTHTQWGDCNEGAYAPGQNNIQPPSSFRNHFVVYCTTDTRIYDPSYGHDFASPDAWEPASISGLYSESAPPDAGYSPVGGARLLQFEDLDTGAFL